MRWRTFSATSSPFRFSKDTSTELLSSPIILLLIVALFIFGTVTTTLSHVASGGVVSYDEEVFQEYVLDQYDAEFGASKQYESNLLVVLLTNENTHGYYYMAAAGYYVQDDVADFFADGSGSLNRVFEQSINDQSYQNTLSGDLVSLVSKLTRTVEGLQDGDTALKPGKTSDTEISSHVTDYSGYVKDRQYVDEVLAEFTATTDVPIVIVVEDMETVFGRYLPFSTIFTLILMIVLAVIAIVWIVKAVKNKNKGGNGGNGGNGGSFNGNPNMNGGNGGNGGGNYNRGGGGSYNRGDGGKFW